MSPDFRKGKVITTRLALDKAKAVAREHNNEVFRRAVKAGEAGSNIFEKMQEAFRAFGWNIEEYER